MRWAAELLGLPAGLVRPDHRHGILVDALGAGRGARGGRARRAHPGHGRPRRPAAAARVRLRARPTRRSRRRASCSASAQEGLREGPRRRRVPDADRRAARRDRGGRRSGAAADRGRGDGRDHLVDQHRPGRPRSPDVCAEHGMWLHVDAAYGGAAAVVPELRHVLDGCDRADSLVVNPHKWLLTPIDCSLLYTSRPGRPARRVLGRARVPAHRTRTTWST